MSARRVVAVFLGLLPAGGVSFAATYTVTNTNDGGAGTLRDAITQANTHPGTDTIVFAGSLKGSVIELLSLLPPVTGEETIIEGDMDADGKPDIGIDGSKVATAGSGLEVRAALCRIVGLAIYGFRRAALELRNASDCTVRTCYLSVRLDGATPVEGPGADLQLVQAHGNRIGGSRTKDRNVIRGGLDSPGSTTMGVHLLGSNDNRILGNYIGLKATGDEVLGAGDYGVCLSDNAGKPSENNRIGGASAGEGNLFAGLTRGVSLEKRASRNVIAGNWFGLAANGRTSLPIARSGSAVMVWDSPHNTVGGTAPGARNVFAGNASQGLTIMGADSVGNRVWGNYFGTNAAGTAQRYLYTAVNVTVSAGAQMIGGDTPEKGNYFAGRCAAARPIAIFMDAGGGSTVRRNVIGVLPNGKDVGHPLGEGVALVGVLAFIRDNVIANTKTGVAVYGDSADARIYGNRFANCSGRAVALAASHARANLGNLGNSSTTDDGGNQFDPTNTWHIENYTSNTIKAEGNDFGTTVKAEINAKIWDRRDNPSLGRVDFDPLLGGVHPTGETLAGLHLTGACATRTRAGAEIAFTLSAPAQVTVEIVNLAGRPVATVARNLPTDAGTQRVLWNGCSDTGLRAPSGRYLARITARTPSGAQTHALTTLAWQ